MNQVIGIIDISDVEYDDTSLLTGCGGSESWTIYLSRELSKFNNTHVIVFCNCEQWHFDELGVEWVPNSLLDSRLQYQQFDQIIISRLFEGVIKLIETSKCCKNIYIQSHDWGLNYWYSDESRYKPYYEESAELKSPILKKIVALSEWHIDSMIKECHIPRDMFTIIPNGVSDSVINSTVSTHTIDHKILWSSRPERGCDILCDLILPKVRRLIPDFEVDIASYDPIQDRFKNRESEGINCLGKLGKSQLYDEMSKHAVWFYPSIYPETFNITSIEAVLCGNMIVMPIQHGMATTFDIFKSIGLEEKFYNEYHVTDGNTKLAVNYAVKRIVDNIKEYHYPLNRTLREIMRCYVVKNYTWKRIAEMYIQLFELTK